jgi:hypothetical protein
MIKDISHDGCRYLSRDELLRVMRAEIPENQYQLGRYGRTQEPVRRGRRNR